uniref:Uncharacterized protein n=1 Tax=Cannabis sativa TaxID=3483 RepID=A0A803QI41_CANSA
MASELKLPVSEHFIGRLTYRGSDRFVHIKAKLYAMNLTERILAIPFEPFWEAGELTFSSTLVHNMRFSRLEFGLITGLLMGSGPTEEEIEAKSSDRLCVIKKCLCPRSSEKEYFKSINEGKPRLCFEMDVDEMVDTDDIRALVERLDRIEAKQAAIILSHTELVTSQTNMRRSFQDSQKKMRQSFLEKEGAPAPSQPIDERPNDNEYEDEFPEDWEEDDNEVPPTPKDAIILAITDTPSDIQSQNDVLLLTGPPEGVPFVRKRKKPCYLLDYTEEKKKKQLLPENVDPERPQSIDCYAH